MDPSMCKDPEVGTGKPMWETEIYKLNNKSKGLGIAEHTCNSQNKQLDTEGYWGLQASQTSLTELQV